MVIYIAGPYTAQEGKTVTENIMAAEVVGKEVALLGHTPLIPHMNTAHWEHDDRFKSWTHAEIIERLCKPLIAKCDAILMMDGWAGSKGANIEFEFVLGRPCIAIFHGIDQLKRQCGVAL